MDQLCIVCQKEVLIVQDKACDCQYCYECCLQWMEAQMNENHKIENFKCLNYDCIEKINIYSFYESISDPIIESKYQEITFKYYLINAKDIKACPNQNCKNQGIIPTLRCSELLECNLCDYKWFDKDCLSITKSCSLFVKNLKNDMLCFIQKFGHAHHCPNCNVEIIKNGGCNHMTCKNCTYEYCYLCNQSNTGHDAKQCNLRVHTFQIILFYLLFVQAYFLGVYFLIQQIVFLIMYAFELLISSNHKLLIMLLIHFSLTIHQIYTGAYKTQRFYCYPPPKKHDKKEICFQLLYLVSVIPLGTLIYYSGLYQPQLIQIYKFLPEIAELIFFSNITALIILKNILKRKPSCY